MEKIFKVIQSSHQPDPPRPIGWGGLEWTLKIISFPSLNHVPVTTRLLNTLQGWGCHQCPGQPVPVPRHLLHEEILPNIQREPPLGQFEAISLNFEAISLNLHAQDCGI